MKQYFTGFFTAVCLTASVFLFMGSQNKNLGDIVAKSIRIMGDGKSGETNIVGGVLQTESIRIRGDGKLGETLIVGGGIGIMSNVGKSVVILSSTKDGTGNIQTYNANEKVTAYLGTNMKNDGTIILFDRYGDTGWLQTGKK